MNSRYFIRKEFACQCGCDFNPVDTELETVLIDLREHYNVPVIITSGCRCRSHNDYVGGAPRSKHCLGIAADIRVTGISPHLVFQYLETRYPGQYGFGDGQTFTHVDVRQTPARWTY